MRNMILFELKKIIRKKSTIYTMLGITLFVVSVFIMSLFQYRGVDLNGNEYSSLKGIKASKEVSNKIFNKKVTDESIKKDIQEFQNYYKENSQINEEGEEELLKNELYYSFFLPRRDYFSWIANNYTEPYLYAMVKSLNKVSVNDASKFYDIREEKVNELLSLDVFGSYSNVEKKYWKEKSINIERPLKYGYKDGWETIFDRLTFFMFVILAVCICIAPIFASEYELNTDAIILTTKHGKSKLIIAKIIAAHIFCMISLLIILSLSVGIVLLLFGAEGWNLNAQVIQTIIPYKLNLLEVTLLWIGVIFVVTLGLVGITLFLSAKLNAAFHVLIIDVAIIFIPTFIPISSNKIINHIQYLLPSTAVDKIFAHYTSYYIGNKVINVYSMIFIVYIIISLIFISLSKKAFKSHQVQ